MTILAASGLSARKRRFVACVLSGVRPVEAGRMVRVSPRTARRYASDPAIRAALAEAQDLAIGDAARQAADAMYAAIDTLQTIMEDATMPSSSRVAAARAILENGARLFEAVTLSERVAQLEQREEAKG